MNISQHSFVPLGFKKGFYNDSKEFGTDIYDTYCTDLFHVDNCNSCILYRQTGREVGIVGGVLRLFNGNSLSFKDIVREVSQFPYIVSFTPASDMECTISYGIPAGMVDFLVYDDPDANPTRI